jgi:hypothetical protein
LNENAKNTELPTELGTISGNCTFSNTILQTHTIEIPTNKVDEFFINPSLVKVLMHKGKKVASTLGCVKLSPGKHIKPFINKILNKSLAHNFNKEN